jgi:hypothetical protein
VADAVREAGATLIAYSPLCQGLLTGSQFRRCSGNSGNFQIARDHVQPPLC